ncbi:hypothetical protein KKF63_04735, partial [bacterium]|nr:hypothetical protein [bacterium]
MITSMFTGSLAHNGFMGLPLSLSSDVNNQAATTDQQEFHLMPTGVPIALGAAGLTVATLFLPSPGHTFEIPKHDPENPIHTIGTILDPDANQLDFPQSHQAAVAAGNLDVILYPELAPDDPMIQAARLPGDSAETYTSIAARVIQDHWAEQEEFYDETNGITIVWDTGSMIEGSGQIGFDSQDPRVHADLFFAAVDGQLKPAMALGQYDPGLAALLTEISPEKAAPVPNTTPPAEESAPERKAERQTPKGLIPGLLIGIPLLVGGIIFGSKYGQYHGLRKRYLNRLQELETQITNARTTITNIYRGNEPILDTWLQELKEVGGGKELIQRIKSGDLKEMLGTVVGQTKDKLEAFAETEHSLNGQIALFEAGINHITQPIGAPSYNKRKELEDALEELNTRKLDQHHKLNELRDVWRALIQAVKAMGSTAEEDFTDEELNILTTHLQQAGLKPSFLNEHPLYENRLGKWAALNQLRQSDPDAYNARIQEYREKEAEIRQDVITLITTLGETKEVKRRLAALRAIGYDTETTVSPTYDPRPHKGNGDRVSGQLDTILRLGIDLKKAITNVKTALGYYEVAYKYKSALIDAIDNARTRVRKAEATFLTTYERLEMALALANELEKVHDKTSRASMLVEAQEARVLVSELAKLFKAIRQYLPRQGDAFDDDFLRAIRAASQMSMDPDGDGGQGQDEQMTQPISDIAPNHREADIKTKAAVAKLETLSKEIDDIDNARNKLDRLVANYINQRSFYATALYRQYRQSILELDSDYADTSLLRPGNELLKTMPITKTEMLHHGPVNWQDKIEQLERVKNLWNKGLETAKNRIFVMNVVEEIKGLETKLAVLRRQIGQLREHH